MKALERRLLNELDFENECKSFAKRSLKRRKKTSDGTIKLCGDIRFLITTSNICERLLSHAGYALSACKSGIDSSNFGAQMLLFSNNDLWDARDRNKMIV